MLEAWRLGRSVLFVVSRAPKFEHFTIEDDGEIGLARAFWRRSAAAAFAIEHGIQ